MAAKTNQPKKQGNCPFKARPPWKNVSHLLGILLGIAVFSPFFSSVWAMHGRIRSSKNLNQFKGDFYHVCDEFPQINRQTWVVMLVFFFICFLFFFAYMLVDRIDSLLEAAQPEEPGWFQM